MKFGKKKELKRKAPEGPARDDEAPVSKYAGSGKMKLPKGGLYDPKAQFEGHNSDNLAALRVMKGGIDVKSSQSTGNIDSKPEYVLNIPQRPDITTADSRASDRRR